MRKSIFEIENRLNIDAEFRNFKQCLFENDSIYFEDKFMNFFEFLNDYVFNLWNYRDTYINLREYLNHIGITREMLLHGKNVDDTSFLNFLELLLNLKLVLEKKFNFSNICYSIRVENIIEHNVPLLLEKMNYVSYQEGDKVLIRKRDADVDSILELVPEDIQTLLLSYNDIRNNNIESKKTILKKIDLFIEKRKGDYKSFNAPTYDTIQTIVNNMGINHPLEKKGYVDMTNKELIAWYDKCFKLMIHLIRIEEVNKINEERKLICLQ